MKNTQWIPTGPIYAVITETDISDAKYVCDKYGTPVLCDKYGNTVKPDGPMIFEQYLSKASLENVRHLAKRLGGLYGRSAIVELVVHEVVEP